MRRKLRRMARGALPHSDASRVACAADVAPSELAQPKVREVLRPPLEGIDWKELAALIAKGWDRQAESRPSARQMHEELCTLNGMPDPSVDVSPMRSGICCVCLSVSV